jgi:hypothetical protein
VIRAAMGVGLHALHRVVAVVSVPAGLVVHFLPRTNRLMP